MSVTRRVALSVLSILAVGCASTGSMAAELPSDIEVVSPHEPGTMGARIEAPWEVGDQELQSALPEFLRIGFAEVGWVTWGKEREDILRNLVGPDYERRTGKEPPAHASFDYALAKITGGEFNDVIVTSRLPGDCLPGGCRVSIFRFDGNEWSLVSSFHAIAVALRPDKGGAAARLVAVGDDVFPSMIMRWDGSTFREE